MIPLPGRPNPEPDPPEDDLPIPADPDTPLPDGEPHHHQPGRDPALR